MYGAIVLIHVVSVVVFALAHLVSAGSMFQVKMTSDRARLTAILGRSATALMVAGIAILIALVAGIVAGIMGGLWGRLWIWVSLVLLILVGGLMTPMAAIPMNQLRSALGIQGGRQKPGDPAPVAQDDAAVAAARAKLRPEVVSIIGVGGYLLILWLMLTKPF
jgi:hypothetical protein